LVLLGRDVGGESSKPMGSCLGWNLFG